MKINSGYLLASGGTKKSTATPDTGMSKGADGLYYYGSASYYWLFPASVMNTMSNCQIGSSNFTTLIPDAYKANGWVLIYITGFENFYDYAYGNQSMKGVKDPGTSAFMVFESRVKAQKALLTGQYLSDVKATYYGPLKVSIIRENGTWYQTIPWDFKYTYDTNTFEETDITARTTPYGNYKATIGFVRGTAYMGALEWRVEFKTR